MAVTDEANYNNNIRSDSSNSTRGSRSSWFNAFDNATSAPSMVMDSALLNESIFYSINSTANSTDPTTLFENFRDESRFWIQRVKLQFFSFFHSFPFSICYLEFR